MVESARNYWVKLVIWKRILTECEGLDLLKSMPLLVIITSDLYQRHMDYLGLIIPRTRSADGSILWFMTDTDCYDYVAWADAARVTTDWDAANVRINE